MIYDVLGARTVFVNAAGCMTLLSVYPLTPFRGSWLYTAMASAPAGAQGVRDALTFETSIEDGEIAHTWGEYLADAISRVNDQNAHRIVLYLAKRDRRAANRG